jgi:hypothetical protein
MRLPNILPAAGGVLFLSLLSGCAPSDTSTPPEPTETFVAPYATDEEALAAAEEAYGEYLRVINFHLHESVLDEKQLGTVAVGAELAGAIESLARMSRDGQYAVGDATFSGMEFQRYSLDGSSSELVSVYLCEDLSEIQLFNSDGKAAGEDGIAPYTLQVTFDYSTEHGVLVVSDRIEWDSSC